MPSYTQVVLTDEVLYLQSKTYSAQDDRRILGDLLTQGVVGFSDCAVTWTSGLTTQIATGVCYVSGGNITDQGKYRVRIAAAKTIAVGAGHATLPRLDQIILRVLDAGADTSGIYEARIEVIPGTATSGATLANRLGATNLNALLENSRSILLLADVLVPAGAAAINQTNIGDKRTFTSIGLPNTSYTVTDATTNTVKSPLSLYHATSVTATVGFGTGLDLYAESAGGNLVTVGRLSAEWTTATAGNETSKMGFSIMGGGSLWVAMELLQNGNLSISGNYTIGGTQIAAANLSNGTVGSGSIVLASGVTGTGNVILASALATYAPLADPAFTGNPTAPTQATGDNSTKIATTAFVKSLGYITGTSPSITTPSITGASLLGTTTIATSGIINWNTMAINKAPGSNAIECYGATLTVGNGLRIPQKAGAPVDGDYSSFGGLEGPGLICVDYTNNRLYVRTSSGVWRYAALV